MRDSNSRLNFASHHDESLLDVLAVFGRGLEESDVVVLSKFLTLIGGYLSGIGHIALIADKNAGDIVRSVFLDLVHPVLDGTEALAVGDVVSHDDTVSTLIIAGSDSLETLLACSVPDLELNGLSIYLNSSNFL